ncbi:hypothetical protein P7C73_g3329, partial [Tremellales sp. Uapishka_1]
MDDISLTPPLPTMTELMTSEPTTLSSTESITSPTSPAQAHLLRRVLSHGSNGSVTTPTGAAGPLSPDGGVRTPKASKAKLGAERDPQQLIPELDQLNVRSPAGGFETLPLSVDVQNGNGQGNGTHPPIEYRSYSMSTSADSTSSGSSFVQPSNLGSSYGPEGFPTGPFGPEDDEAMTAAKAAVVVAAADEAVKQLNGTSSVVQSQGPSTPGLVNPDYSYQLPRGYANFTQPQVRPTPPDHAVTRQSSTSSTTTEASTSSEEEDLCVPSIMWVDHPPSTQGQGAGSLYYTNPVAAFQQQRGVATRSPARMPPPISTGRGVSSPRRGSNPSATQPHPPLAHQHSILPVGASAMTPSGLGQSSALPVGVSSESVAEDDDDDATVGHGREQSPTTSSQSGQSGLDLLWKAAHHHHPDPNSEDRTKGKRKVGAEVVAQWRNTGTTASSGSNPQSGYPATSDLRGGGQYADPNSGWTDEGMPPPGGSGGRKRRRSQVKMEDIDPVLRDQSAESMDEGNASEFQENSDEDQSEDDESDYQGSKGKKVGVRGRGVKKAATGRGRTSVGSTTGKVSAVPKKVRKVGGTASPTGARGGRRISSESTSNIQGQGVQCEYVNPLPPYNRCQDFFTRKYDLPRHMARHARREGELVFEGRLAEDKAVLWKTIKDKPRVSCTVCGESFTRMDALKRHQTKQHHS